MYPYQQFPYQPYQFSGGAAQPLRSQPQQASDGLSNVRFVSGEAEARQCACPLGSRVLSLTLSGVSGTIGQTSLAVARVA